MSAPLLAVEWATTQLRARLLSAEGKALREYRVAAKLADLDRDGIVALLETVVSRLPEGAGRILLSGMIGSAMGWREVPRIACPADAAAIARGVVEDRIGAHRVHFIPGLHCTSRFGDPDVLRGEEVAALGVLAELGRGSAKLLSVPGMHGKWLELGDGRIGSFSTAMTVDLHHLLAEHSILAPLMALPADNDEAFAEGVRRAAGNGGIARLLFAARSAVALGALREAAAASYLWGVLIGSDVCEQVEQGGEVRVIGAAPAAAMFRAAIAQLGGIAREVDPDAITARGFTAIARLIGPAREQAA
jgi:2-dehydro-3-deoxygalactonokinase